MTKFVDEATISVRAGCGGNGCVSFRREKYVPRGGPDGGDGGKGGDVIFAADPSVETLLDFKFRPQYDAENGRHGMGKQMFGRNGQDLRIRVPVGTVVRDHATGLVLKDLDQPGQEIVIVRGGKGGRGNKHFASSTNRTPRNAEEGQPGEERVLDLELKLVADVGLVGLPNAGKSSFLRRVSSARPKVADYPFTTLEPQLGIVAVHEDARFVVADLPGLIEGAHEGAGLGDQFLRHIERTRVILYILDASGLSGMPPADAYRTLQHELSSYSASLASRPSLVAANKMDLSESIPGLETLRKELGVPVFPISALTGQGIPPLLNAILEILAEIKGRPG
jgi:GTP-binding protein